MSHATLTGNVSQSMEFGDDLRLLETTHPELAKELTPFRSLEGVLNWMKQRGIPLGQLEIVFQDEYSHDALVPLGSHGPFLAFGIT